MNKKNNIIIAEYSKALNSRTRRRRSINITNTSRHFFILTLPLILRSILLFDPQIVLHSYLCTTSSCGDSKICMSTSQNFPATDQIQPHNTPIPYLLRVPISVFRLISRIVPNRSRSNLANSAMLLGSSFLKLYFFR